MIKIIYPDQKPAIKSENGKEYIFCVIRKRWFVITPEEWVRQNFLLYLIHTLQYPTSLISAEKQLTINEVKKRFDIVVYQAASPYIIVECKEMNIALSESTIRQVLNYNATIQAHCIVVTNGSYCAAFVRKDGKFIEIFEIPLPIKL